MNYDVIILGAGPAGLSAAIYCKRAGLNVLVLDRYIIGGNLNNYLEIQNYLGFTSYDTQELAMKFSEHLSNLGIEVKEFVNIEEVDLQNKIVKTSENEYWSKFIIIATGSKPRMLNVPGEEEYIGKGVHYCAICDGPLYKDKIVAVIGGGNSACEEALGLSKICKKVYIIEYTDKLNAEQITLDKINNTENIEVFTNRAVMEIIGHERVESFDMKFREHVEDNSIIPHNIRVDGIFIYVGMSPNLPSFKQKPMIFTNDAGYIYVDENMRTPIKDIYAIGDIRIKDYRQVVTAISDGAVAAISIARSR